MNDLIRRITRFLQEIGIELRAASLDDSTFLPGITVQHGVLVFDEGRLQYPGDLLHEAGHLAVVSSARRRQLNGAVPRIMGEEMCAITWSYAAAVHLEIPLEVVFHDGGYRGGGQSFIDNFSAGRYFAVCTLEWLGLTTEPKKTLPPGTVVFPKMHKWIVD